MQMTHRVCEQKQVLRRQLSLSVATDGRWASKKPFTAIRPRRPLPTVSSIGKDRIVRAGSKDLQDVPPEQQRCMRFRRRSDDIIAAAPKVYSTDTCVMAMICKIPFSRWSRTPQAPGNPEVTVRSPSERLKTRLCPKIPPFPDVSTLS